MQWWFGLGGLVLAGVIGLIGASRAETGIGESSGVALAVFATAAAFMLIKQIFDDGRDRFFPDFALHEEGSRVAFCAVLVVVFVFGLLVSARVGGEFYRLGLALAAVSTAGIFITIKGHFDEKA